MAEYNQKTIEQRWRQFWEKQKTYHFDFSSKKPPYSIDVPPRYASGPLHAGHAVHYTHIDFAARYKRMRGYEVFFPLCFDVNGIPIEERVERNMGITRKDIDRHEFIKHCSAFAEQNIATMIEQFHRLGESMDPSIYYQTNAEYYRRITQLSFLNLYDKGHVYKGKFPVNWCPRCMTAMADAEVSYKDRQTKLNTIKFYFVQTPSEQLLKYHGIGKDTLGVYLEIATTRPELLASCQLVAVHPTDERAAWLIDQQLQVPLFDKQVRIVGDEAVDPLFGTGVVMICTIGDKEDLNWVFKYKLPLEMSIDEEGRMTKRCGKYHRMSIEEARQETIKDLAKNNLLLKQQPLDQNVGACWRCKTPVEFINADQWFLKTTPFKNLVLNQSDSMQWFPEFMKIRLEEWVNSLEWDWVISRQRYFATPIPLWECNKCHEVVVARPEQCYIDPTIDPPPVPQCPKCQGDLKGSEDVFDTWMDSSISPLYNTFWQRDEQRFKYLYPMSVRPQSHDIIRTWAFYTILRCTLITDEKPFKDIMMGGFILSEDGTPMHASIGNVIDPMGIIEEFGADPFRCYAASCALGEDNPFRKKDVVRGVKLLRKLWNVQQFIGSIIQSGKPTKPVLQDVDLWILSKFNRLVDKCIKQMDVFDYSQTMKDIEYFLWHELADHYLEMIKESYRAGYNKQSICYTLYTIGFGVLCLFAPFFPFLSEELYDKLYKQYEHTASIHQCLWPTLCVDDVSIFEKGEIIKDYIAQIRAWKSEQGLALNAPLPALATYASEDIVDALSSNKFIITSTLKLPSDHTFIVGKPEVEERITKITPVYAVIGPHLKHQGKDLITWIQKHQKHLIELIESKGDVFPSDIKEVSFQGDKGLVEQGFVHISRDMMRKGTKHTSIVGFDGFYLEYKKA